MKKKKTSTDDYYVPLFDFCCRNVRISKYPEWEDFVAEGGWVFDTELETLTRMTGSPRKRKASEIELNSEWLKRHNDLKAYSELYVLNTTTDRELRIININYIC